MSLSVDYEFGNSLGTYVYGYAWNFLNLSKDQIEIMMGLLTGSCF